MQNILRKQGIQNKRVQQSDDMGEKAVIEPCGPVTCYIVKSATNHLFSELILYFFFHICCLSSGRVSKDQKTPLTTIPAAEMDNHVLLGISWDMFCSLVWDSLMVLLDNQLIPSRPPPNPTGLGLNTQHQPVPEPSQFGGYGPCHPGAYSQAQV